MMLSLAQFWPFIHPGLAGAGLAVGAIPIIIHLINRRKYRRVPWAAMSFLIRAKRQAARRVWLEHWLLLLLRIALIVLLGLAVARPFTNASQLANITGGRGHHIILFDNSLSMQAVDGKGVSRFDRAKASVDQLLDSFPENDSVILITTAYPAKAVIGHPESDRRVIRERFGAVKETQLRSDFRGAVSLVENVLDAVDLPRGSCSVQVVSDFPSYRMLGPDRGEHISDTAPATLTTLALQRLAEKLAQSSHALSLLRIPTQDEDNIAITALSLSSPMVAVGFPLQVSIVVNNFGTTSGRGLTLTLSRDRKVMRTETLPTIGPGQHYEVSMSHLFQRAGHFMLEASLDLAHQDALPVDDTRRLAVEVAARLPVLLVDGRRASSWLSGQSGFIAASLAPELLFDEDISRSRNASSQKDSLFSPTIVDPAELASEALDAYPVIYLCNVSRLSPAQWSRLASYVSRGGGLGIFAGDLVQIENYNRFGFADGAGLLPGDLQATRSVTNREEAWAITEDALPHAIVKELMSFPDSGLFLARISQYLPLRPRADADVVLNMSHGKPLMVVSKFGQGRVLYMASSSDMAWNNLPAKGDFVSLIVNSTAYLAKSQGTNRTVVVGDDLKEPLIAAEASLPAHVVDANGTNHEGQYVSSDGALAYSFGPVTQSGVMGMTIGTSSRVFAVNVDLHESDIRSVSRATLEKIMSGGARIEDIQEGVLVRHTSRRTSELAPYALFGVIILMLTEILLSAWLGMRREPVRVARAL